MITDTSHSSARPEGQLWPYQINSSGVVMGGYQPIGSNEISYSFFIYDHSTVPWRDLFRFAAINDRGQAVGAYYDAMGASSRRSSIT
jgi:hypothetical protein